MKKIVWMLICAGCLIGVVCIGVSFITGHMQEEEQQQIYEELTEETEKIETEEIEEEPELTPEEILENKYLALEEKYGIQIPRKELNFESLRENTNADIYAWIYVPETQVDYPVVQHPSDNAYYLNRNLDGSKGYPGCIYTESYNQKDFSDSHTVLYGHNMKNGSMFGELHNYEDSEFFEKQPYIYIYTQDDILVYQIFRAYAFTDAHLLVKYDCTTEKGFDDYIETIRNHKTMTDNVNEELFSGLESSDRICTLSTCVKNKSDQRYLVQGVLLSEN